MSTTTTVTRTLWDLSRLADPDWETRRKEEVEYEFSNGRKFTRRTDWRAS